MSHEDDGPPIEILGQKYDHQLADGEYDVVFFSTGLKECLLAGLLAVRGWKVLQLDRNAYYGGACASLNLEELYTHFKQPYNAKEVEAKFGPPRRYCVDLVPKFLMANGDIVRMLIQTGVTRYIDFQGISGSYVVASSMFSAKGSIYKVPVTPTEALKSSLVGALQKRSLMNFATWLDKYQVRNKEEDNIILSWSEEEFAMKIKQYLDQHGVSSDAITSSSKNRLHVAFALEQKYALPLVPTTVEVEFSTGPLGMRIDGRSNANSMKMKTLTRVLGFMNNADGTLGQAERSGKVLPMRSIISHINGESCLELTDAQVTKKLVETARPVRVTFMTLRDTSRNELPNVDLRSITMKQLYAHFGLDENSSTFIGHAMALETSDAYMNEPAEATVEKVQLYGKSVGRYGQNSPYLYPLYGLSTLPEGFSRLAAIYGGTVMLRCPADVNVLVNPTTQKVEGIRVGNKAARCKFVIGQASYFAPEQSVMKKKVARSICLLKHAIAQTDGGDSGQIILPANTLKNNKKHDIYISCVSSTHQVCSEGVFLAIVSTVAETSEPFAKELAPAFEFLGQIEQRFDSLSEVRMHNTSKERPNQLVLEDLDETSHFESAALDILQVYRKVFGKTLDLTEKLVPDQQE